MNKRTKWNWVRAIHDEHTPQPWARRKLRVTMDRMELGMYEDTIKAPSRHASKHPSLAIEDVWANNAAHMYGVALNINSTTAGDVVNK
mmetsp:Transcript_373/g.1546  ORF Transcript_373/g.1546 Transcript_373/m.1546 type:complete len:88 (+) Transcript_373:260-523(+)